MFGARRHDVVDPPAPLFVFRRIEVRAALVIPRPRAVVWEAFDAQAVDDHGGSGHFDIVGAPEAGLGAKSLRIGPPMPLGLRVIMHTEVIAEEPGFWRTTQMIGGIAEQTETLMLADVEDGRTRATVNSLMSRMMPSDQDLEPARVVLHGLAMTWLERISRFAEEA